MEDYVIETSGLAKRYGPVVAVDDLSLRVPRGRVFGLLGPNGAGKTTTMGMLLGLVRPTAGSVRLFGKELAESPRNILRRVGAIVESPAFYPYLSGRDNLRYLQGIGGYSNSTYIDHLLGKVGLADRADSEFRTYSLGMKQRLGLAYALLGDPELLILDEPTNGMDPAGMVEVRELIRGLGDDGCSVLLSSHLLHEVEELCDSVAILSHGKLVAEGEVEKLLLNGRRAVSISTTDDVKAEEVVSSLAWVSRVNVENGSLMVTAPPERSPEISAALSAQGIHITEMSQVKESLEEYYLEVTGERDAASEEQTS